MLLNINGCSRKGRITSLEKKDNLDSETRCTHNSLVCAMLRISMVPLLFTHKKKGTWNWLLPLKLMEISFHVGELHAHIEVVIPRTAFLDCVHTRMKDSEWSSEDGE